MIFQINIRGFTIHDSGNTIAHVSWPQKHSNVLLALMDTVQYYNYLQDVFEDISVYSRVGVLSFCNTDADNLRISWQVAPHITSNSIFPALVAGLNKLNKVKRDIYLKKYAISNVYKIFNADFKFGFSGPYTITGEVWKEESIVCEMHSGERSNSNSISATP